MARRWMNKMGYHWKKEPKAQYKDGHECEDVVAYRQNVFLPFISGPGKKPSKQFPSKPRDQVNVAQGLLKIHLVQADGLWFGFMMSLPFMLMIDKFCTGCILPKLQHHMRKAKGHHKWLQTMFRQIMVGWKVKTGESASCFRVNSLFIVKLQWWQCESSVQGGQE